MIYPELNQSSWKWLSVNLTWSILLWVPLPVLNCTLCGHCELVGITLWRGKFGWTYIACQIAESRAPWRDRTDKVQLAGRSICVRTILVGTMD